jgi:hypothetical protein
MVVGVAILLGAVAAAFAIEDATSSHGPDRLEAVVSTVEGAREFAAFLEEHDGEVVYLEIECDEFLEVSFERYTRSGSHCLSRPIHPYSDSSPYATLLITYGGERDAKEASTEPYRRGDARDDASTWIPHRAETDATVTNGDKGAGFILVKGYYEVVLEEGGVAPPEAQRTELRAVPAPR